MTEEQNSIGQATPDSSSSSTGYVAEQAPAHVAEASPQPEKMLPQSEVNKIVAANKKSAYEKAKQDALAEMQKENGNSSNVESSKVAPTSINIREEIDKYAQELYANEQANALKVENDKIKKSLLDKISKTTEKYPDFDPSNVSNDYDAPLGLLYELDKFDNAGDMIYHMEKDPKTFSTIALNFLNPKLVRTGIALLKQHSESLKNLEQSKKKGTARSPLSQIQPSNVGADGGKPTITQLRRRWLG